LSTTCYPLKGSGGLKGAARDIAGLLPKYKFFCKTDVKSYYTSIDHFNLLIKLHDYITDKKSLITSGSSGTGQLTKAGYTMM
jgi:hypothetical protein